MNDDMVYKITLDNRGAITSGTEQIYLRYNDGYYLERFCETKLVKKSVAIVCPVENGYELLGYTEKDSPIVRPIKYGYIFSGYNTEKSGNGQTIINSKGLINVDVSYNTFKADTTLYAIWKSGYECTSELLGSLCATLSPSEEPYEIRILDNNLDLSVINNVLNYTTRKINLDLSLCTRLQSIESGAFDYCRGLVGITIPSSVTRIDSNSFSNCESLSSIIVDKDNTMYDSRENCNAIIETSTNMLVLGCRNSVVPDGTRIIRNSAFENCKGLENITIPDSVISIGNNAFSGCSGLTTLTIKAITPPRFYDYNLSYYCPNLTTIYVPSESVSAYKTANGWSNYADKIRAIEE